MYVAFWGFIYGSWAGVRVRVSVLRNICYYDPAIRTKSPFSFCFGKYIIVVIRFVSAMFERRLNVGGCWAPSLFI